jgi:hypothetical protein
MPGPSIREPEPRPNPQRTVNAMTIVNLSLTHRQRRLSEDMTGRSRGVTNGFKVRPCAILASGLEQVAPRRERAQRGMSGRPRRGMS